MAHIPAQIIGHEKQCGQLLQDIAKNNVSHAYLFCGPKHIGKFSLARWFALQLLGDEVPAEKKAGVQDQIERMIHPDFLSLDQLWIEEIQEDWNQISKTSNIAQQHRSKVPKARTDSIGIDEVRALQERLYDTGSSKHFVCLIRSMERMAAPAATAFLKVLEEPPPRVVFVLTTESETRVLNTVLSRTRVLKFHRLHDSQLQPLVGGMEPDDASFVLHLAQGAPGKAINLMKDPDALRAEKLMHSQATQFWRARTAYERLPWITEFLAKPGQTEGMLLHLGLTLREQPVATRKPHWAKAYVNLVNSLATNAHRGLLLQRFALALDGE